jgi:hypothetical protein
MMMRKLMMIAALGYGVSFGGPTLAQINKNQLPKEAYADSTGLPGDDFSLAGALTLFQKANNVEQFEQWINDPEQHVNNVDLNADGEVDYIRVVDQSAGADHALVLQVPINESESQDIAVIEIAHLSKDSAIVQIIGDVNLYGEDVIVEPSQEFEQEIKKAKGPSFSEFRVYRWVMNVWMWPCVQFIYRPNYQPWVSPYYWRHYPPYWKPWKRYHWHQHWWFCYHQHQYGRYGWKANALRCQNVHKAYWGHRKSCASIEARYRKHPMNRAHQKEHGHPSDQHRSNVKEKKHGQKEHQTKDKTLKSKGQRTGGGKKGRP